MRPWLRVVAAGFSAAGLLSISAPTWAANIPNYDMTMHRTRLVHGSTENATDQLYSDIPVYLQIPAGTTSFSTPNVMDSTVYQYTFSGGGIGYLSALALPNLSYKTVLADANKTHHDYVIQSAGYAQSEVEFYAGTGDGVNYASGQSSLSTGPVVKGFADGTQYQAIAVGKYLYSWPQSSYGHSVRAFIRGNKDNLDYQVDDSPLITPPVTVHGAGGTSWTSPVAVIGSWDGGLVATPVDVPAGDYPINQDYYSAQLNNGIGTTAYPHSTADITSDPTWVGSVPGLGADCVAFGIAGGAHPRVILFNVTTGHYKAIGVGEIGSGISDTTLFDAATGTLYVQDLYGALYAFGLNGALKAVYGPGSWTSSHMILGQDMALVPSALGTTLYAIGGGGNVLGQFSLGLTLEKSSGRFGPDVSSPAFLTAPSNTDSSLLVISNEAGNIYLRGDTLSVFTSESNQYDQAIGQSKSPPWAGYLPDAGTYHDLIGWTNSDPNGDPAVVVYVPAKYSIAATVDTKQAIKLSKAAPVTITGIPSPSGVTYDNGNNNWTPRGYGGGDPVEYEITTSTGLSVESWQGMNHTALDQWQGTWTPPVNTTKNPITYDITVEGVDELGQTAQAPVGVNTVTVEPSPPASKGPTPGTGGTLTLACGWGNGTADITQSHSCTIPEDDGYHSARWFVNNPQIGVKFGDTINSTLTIPPPKLPNLPGLQIESVVLDAKIPYREGFSNQPGQRGYVPGTPQLYNYFPATVVMTPQGSPISYTAKGFMIESWAGWPPPTTQQGLSQGDTITLTAEWTAHVTYSYLVSTATGVFRQTAYFTYAGTASAPVTENGTDYYIIWTPQGY